MERAPGRSGVIRGAANELTSSEHVHGVCASGGKGVAEDGCGLRYDHADGDDGGRGGADG